MEMTAYLRDVYPDDCIDCNGCKELVAYVRPSRLLSRWRRGLTGPWPTCGAGRRGFPGRDMQPLRQGALPCEV